MNREQRYGAYMGLMIGLLLGLILLLQGCTIYTVERTNDTTKVTVISTRDFEQPELHYERTAEGAVFDFGATSARNSISLNELIGLLQAVAAGQIPVTAPPGE